MKFIPYALSFFSRPNITGAIRDTIASNSTKNRFHWIVDLGWRSHSLGFEQLLYQRGQWQQLCEI